ncbi:MAG: hypothetical protein LBU80_00465 [Rikenellaceae bacterium]|jgi:hypothetical protein|nr:hypothetical protein [Rikenellaceae bacterium]
MERKKQFFSILRTGMFGLAACSLLFAGCSNLKDDVDELKAQMNDVKSQLATLDTWAKSGSLYVSHTGDGTSSDIVVTLTNGKSVTIPKNADANRTTLTEDEDYFIVSVTDPATGSKNEVKIPKVNTSAVPTSITIIKSEVGNGPMIEGVADYSTIIRVNPSNIDPAKLKAGLVIDDVSSYASDATSTKITVEDITSIDVGTYRVGLKVVDKAAKLYPNKLYVAFYQDPANDNIGITSATPINDVTAFITVIEFKKIEATNITLLDNSIPLSKNPVMVAENFGFSQVKDTANFFMITYPKAAIKSVEYYLVPATKTAPADAVDWASVTQVLPETTQPLGTNNNVSYYPFEITANDAKFTPALGETAVGMKREANVLIVVTDIQDNKASKVLSAAALTGHIQFNSGNAFSTWTDLSAAAVPPAGVYPVTYMKSFATATSYNVAVQPAQAVPVGPGGYGISKTADVSANNPAIWSNLPAGWTAVNLASDFSMAVGVLNGDKLMTDTVRNGVTPTAAGSTTLNYVITTNATPGNYTVTFRASDDRPDATVAGWKAGHYDIPLPIVVTGYTFKASYFANNVKENITTNNGVHTSFLDAPAPLVAGLSVTPLAPYADTSNPLFKNVALVSGTFAPADVNDANGTITPVAYAISNATLVFEPTYIYKASPTAGVATEVKADVQVEPILKVATQVTAGGPYNAFVTAGVNNTVGTHPSPLFPVTIYDVNGTDKVMDPDTKFPLIVKTLKYDAARTVTTAVVKKWANPLSIAASTYVALYDVKGQALTSFTTAPTYTLTSDPLTGNLGQFIAVNSTSGEITQVGAVGPTTDMTGTITISGGKDIFGNAIPTITVPITIQKP